MEFLNGVSYLLSIISEDHILKNPAFILSADRLARVLTGAVLPLSIAACGGTAEPPAAPSAAQAVQLASMQHVAAAAPSATADGTSASLQADTAAGVEASS